MEARRVGGRLRRWATVAVTTSTVLGASVLGVTGGGGIAHAGPVTLNETYAIPLLGGFAQTPTSIGSEAPATVAPGADFTAAITPSAYATPTSETVAGFAATVNFFQGFQWMIPIPANSTYVSSSLSSSSATWPSGSVPFTVNYCTAASGFVPPSSGTYTEPACSATPNSSSVTPFFGGNTSTPFLEISTPAFGNTITPADEVPAGVTVTFPTLSVVLAASGTPGSTIQPALTEYDSAGDATVGPPINATLLEPVATWPTAVLTSGQEASSNTTAPPLLITPLSTTTIVAPTPTVTAVSPLRGTTAGGTSVTITGSNLGNATAVDFGSTPATITADSATSITVTTPPEAAGAVFVTVTTALGTSPAGNGELYTYVAPPPPCTFNGDSASSGVSGVTSGSSITVACTSLNTGDTYSLDEESPLAQVITPTSDAGQVEGGGPYDMSSGALVGTTWSPSYLTPSGTTVGTDPNSTCPPTQAQIDAGLVDCTLNLVDDGPTGSTIYAGVPLQYAGQDNPAAPTLAVSPTTAGPGTSVTVSDATGATSSWWGSGTVLTGIPQTDIIVGGVAATSSTVYVQPASYAANGTTGTLTPPKLTGAFVVPSGPAAGTQTVSIYEPNYTVVAGNSTNASFPDFVSGSTSISLGVSGYWLVGKDGGIFTYGGTPFYGSCPQIKGGCPGSVVGMAPTGDGQGYWLADTHGDIYTYGDAAYYGSIPGLGKAVRNIVGIVVTADAKGYWLVGSDGGVFTFGDAGFDGSCPQLKGGCPGHVVALLPTADGQGYWLVDTHGDLYTYGDAAYFGSIPGLGRAVTNIVAMARTLDGKGYWLVAGNGGVFTFGDAPFEGSCGTLTGGKCGATVVGIAASPDGQGYWLTDTHGDIYAFGDAAYDGGLGGVRLNSPVIDIEAG